MRDTESLIPEAGNLDNFIKHFPVFAAAPGGIEKLRSIILQLGVQGNLTEQFIDYENANNLLNEINNRKNNLVKQKLIKKSKSLFPNSASSSPYTLPDNWSWALLGEISEMLVDGSHNPPKKVDDGIPMLSGQNVRDGYITLEASRYITEDDYVEELKRNPIEAGDVFLSIVGSIGRSSVVPNDFPKAAIQRSVAQIRAFLDPHYLSLFLRAPISRNYYLANAKGTAQKGIYLNQLSLLDVAVPPLEEQKRIVAKVDELMALVDKLEAQQQEQARTVLQANTAAINALLNPSEDSSFNENWNRIAAHFNTLYGCTLPMPKGEGRQKKHLVGLENVNALSSVIVRLAVQGKLTAQIKNDETSKDLYRKIVSAKEALISLGKLKKIKPLPCIEKNEEPFDIPNSWKFTRFNDVVDVRDGTHNSPKNVDGSHTYPLVTSKDFKNGDIDFSNTKQISEIDHIEISKRSLVEVEDILFSMIGGNIGNQVLVNDPRPFSIKNVALFKFYDKHLTLPKYVKIYTEYLATKLQHEAIGGAQPFISLGALRNLVFPLPPLEEQKRIVAKVDELMTICDRLEEQFTQAYTDAETLMQATVKSLVAV